MSCDWIREYHEEEGKKITCNQCSRERKTFQSNYFGIRKFITHLRVDHQITALTNHPDRGYLETKFVIRSRGRCRDCKKQVKFIDNVNNLKNHLVMYHGSKSYIFTRLKKFPEAEQIIRQCNLITDSEVECSKCSFKTDLEKDTLTKLTEFSLHWVDHLRSKNRVRKARIDQQKKNILKQYKKLKEAEADENVKMLLNLNKDLQNDLKHLTMNTGDLNEPGTSTDEVTGDFSEITPTEQTEGRSISIQRHEPSSQKENRERLPSKEKEEGTSSSDESSSISSSTTDDETEPPEQNREKFQNTLTGKQSLKRKKETSDSSDESVQNQEQKRELQRCEDLFQDTKDSSWKEALISFFNPSLHPDFEGEEQMDVTLLDTLDLSEPLLKKDLISDRLNQPLSTPSSMRDDETEPPEQSGEKLQSTSAGKQSLKRKKEKSDSSDSSN